MTIQDKFLKFHSDNPNVYNLLVQFANEVKDAGHNTYSIKALFEVVRWHINVKTKSDDIFKLNNNYHSRYARLIEENESNLSGFFKKRELQTK